jgi:hypothetical protein
MALFFFGAAAGVLIGAVPTFLLWRYHHRVTIDTFLEELAGGTTFLPSVYD